MISRSQEQTVKASQASQLEKELLKLKEENVALNRKVSELSGVETAKKKAESKAQLLEERMEDMISERVSQKENELNATYDERLRNYEDRFVISLRDPLPVRVTSYQGEGPRTAAFSVPKSASRLEDV